jgi:hypothetical protein
VGANDKQAGTGSAELLIIATQSQSAVGGQSGFWPHGYPHDPSLPEEIVGPSAMGQSLQTIAF